MVNPLMIEQDGKLGVVTADVLKKMEAIATFITLFASGDLFRVADRSRMLAALDIEGFRRGLRMKVAFQHELATLMAQRQPETGQPGRPVTTDSRKRRKLKRKAA